MISGEVEDWLNQVDNNIKDSLRKLLKKAKSEYDSKELEDWVLVYPSQIVCIVSLIISCAFTEASLSTMA